MSFRLRLVRRCRSVPRTRRRLRLLAVSFTLALLSPLIGADDLTLARVGERQIDASEFERRARLIDPAQWGTWGATWAERRRRLLDDVLIAEVLLDAEAARETPPVASPARTALARAVVADVRAEASATPPSRAEVEQYYRENRREYETEAALLLWRILLRDEKKARELITLLATPTVATFSRLARDESVDEATSMRAGSLGYVAADGQTQMPQVRVAKALFEAANHVKDGELVKEPVREGELFAVVWRRGNRPAQRETLAEVTPLIEQRLLERAAIGASRELVERLRRDALREHRPELLVEYEPTFALPETVA